MASKRRNPGDGSEEDMSWTGFVICSDDGAWDWAVVNGVWTCKECGKAMTVTEVAAYHKQLP